MGLFLKNGENTWKGFTFWKAHACCMGKKTNGGGQGRCRERAAFYCCTCLFLYYCELLEAETISMFPSHPWTVSCIQVMLNNYMMDEPHAFKWIIWSQGHNTFYVLYFPPFSSLQLIWGKGRCSHIACSLNIIVCCHYHFRLAFAEGYLDNSSILNPSTQYYWGSAWHCHTLMCLGPCQTFKERDRIKSIWASFLNEQSSK